jgi:hypothetical protein
MAASRDAFHDAALATSGFPETMLFADDGLSGPKRIDSILQERSVRRGDEVQHHEDSMS